MTDFDYFVSQDGMIVIPIDYFSEQGITSDFSTFIEDSGLLGQQSIAQINQTIAAYFNRARQLSSVSRQWFQPRIQHLCLVTKGERIRPFFQPFHANSWLLYDSDFHPETSSVELSIFLLFQAERMFMQQQIAASLLTNLPYFLILTDTQIDNFVDGCERSDRPDADFFRSFASKLPQLRRLHHVQFNRPSVALQGYQTTQNGLIVDADDMAMLDSLQQDWIRSAEAVMSAHRAHYTTLSPDAGRRLLTWLDDRQPDLLISGDDGDILWQPGCSDHSALQSVLAEVSTVAEEEIKKDLQVIDYYSKKFLETLAEPDQLVDPAPYITEGGLSYIHPKLKRIAYNLGADNADRLWQPSPPYERWMLAARTVHEWGHLAAESGWVAVPEELSETRKNLEAALVDEFEAMVNGMSARVRHLIEPELAGLSKKADRAGEALLKAMLRRIEDFMANLVAQDILNADEMDTYVRNNVASRLLEYRPEQMLMHLIRTVYEFQYLRLSRIRDRSDWFMKSTWFQALFIDSGVLSQHQFEQLEPVVAGICDCYRIDRQWIRATDS